MLFGGDVAEHGAAELSDHRRSDGGSDVIVARGDVGGQRPQGVEGRLVTVLELELHVLGDLVHRHVAGALDHHLNIVLPRLLGQLAQDLELSELGLVVGIGDAAWTQAVPQ